MTLVTSSGRCFARDSRGYLAQELSHSDESFHAPHVYANGHEIAAKAVGKAGASSSATPDPCWSPPGPAAGPVVVPYPNTCSADSISNGTSTVFIGGQQVAIEDRSYFATSIGNEAATQAFGKGVASHVITGRGYFTQWSHNVSFEGFGVPRDLDLVGHNHGSMPSNTPLFPYLSRATARDCSSEKQRIERACAKESEHSDSRKAIRSKSRARSLLRRQGSNNKSTSAHDWHWTDDHCDGLQINLNSYQRAKDYAQQMKQAYQELPEMLNVMGALESELQEMVTKAGAKALAKWTAKAGVKQVAGTSLPVIGNALMAVWSVVDAALAIGNVNEIRRVAAESLEQLRILRSKASDLQSLSARFKNLDGITDEKEILQLAAEGQEVLATLNECTRARKCNLVPKSQKDRSPNVETADGKGCCPGQTGHHLIYGAMMDGLDCPGYKYETAPTVCVEGFSQNHGSHGRVHDAMDREVTALAKNGQLQNGTMSMKQALDAATRSHSEAFPLSRCSPECIRAQLEGYYKCSGARPKAVNKYGAATVPDHGRD